MIITFTLLENSQCIPVACVFAFSTSNEKKKKEEKLSLALICMYSTSRYIDYVSVCLAACVNVCVPSVWTIIPIFALVFFSCKFTKNLLQGFSIIYLQIFCFCFRNVFFSWFFNAI